VTAGHTLVFRLLRGDFDIFRNILILERETEIPKTVNFPKFGNMKFDLGAVLDSYDIYED